MTMFTADGKFVSIAKAGCEFCGGTGISLIQETSPEGATLRFIYCNCIDVAITDKNGKQIHPKLH